MVRSIAFEIMVRQNITAEAKVSPPGGQESEGGRRKRKGWGLNAPFKVTAPRCNFLPLGSSFKRFYLATKPLTHEPLRDIFQLQTIAYGKILISSYIIRKR